jgi:hypothetical protein
MIHRYSFQSSPLLGVYSQLHYYEWITRRCTDQIEQAMADARRHSGLESRYRTERAYGVYMGWRALVMELADPAEFARDDKNLEGLLEKSTQ